MSRALQHMEIPLLLAVPVVMAAALLAGIEQAALAMLVVVALVLALFFAGYEVSRPGLRQIMPTLVLAALAAAGRILFGPIPDFKPVSAIAIIAGATLGRRNGFMVGALAALTSNFFFGQGMWTPWQMFAMGLLGFFAGIIFSKKRNTLALCIYSFLSVLVIYGGIMNISSVLTYTTDINLQTITAYIVSGIPFDLIHAVSTVIFVLITGDALLKKCCRLRAKFGLFQ